MISMTRTDFRDIASIVYKVAGIALSDGKFELVQSRLRKRVVHTRKKSYSEYVRYVQGEAGGKELQSMIDAITTNETRFFREAAHFDFLRDVVFRETTRPLRIWCAAASTGEEPYSIAITLRDHFQQSATSKVLATDINCEVLAVARRAVYSEARIASLPATTRDRHFRQVNGTNGDRQFQVKPDTRGLVRFARLNLVNEWPMKGAFDVIFLRNVMIYFDGPTRQWLGARACAHLRPGGYLFIGHSESLGINPPGYRNIQPAIYQRTEGSEITLPRRPM